jgi:AcrR family transcriptional regulator
MGIAERKLREKEERRALILDKARELVLERGVNAFTVQDIANDCELSKATLYLYFDSKEAILAEVLRTASDNFVSYVFARIKPEASGLEALNALWGAFISLYGESEDIFVLIGIKNYLYPGFPFAPDVGFAGEESPEERLAVLIADVLGRGVRDGTLDANIEPDRLARTVIMVATGIVDAVARLPRPKRDAKLIRAEMTNVFQILLRGLAAEGCDRSLLKLY